MRRFSLLLCCVFTSHLFPQSNEADLARIYEAGERALAEHRYAEAEQAFERLKTLSPSTAEVYGRLGLVYFQEGKYAKAVPALRQALKLKPGLPNTDVLLALSLSELGHYREAQSGLEKGFHKSNDPPLKRLCGLQLLRAYTGLQRNNEAMGVALELNRLYPDDPEVLYHTSRIYANSAYLTLVRLREVAPSSVWRHLAAGEAYESQGSYDLAVTEYREVLQLDPNRPGIHFRLGRALLARAQQSGGGPDLVAQAAREFEQELKRDPTNGNASYELGEIDRKSGQLERARALFAAAVEQDPDFEDAQIALGRVLLAQSKPDSALAHLEKAISLDPSNEVAYYHLAQVEGALGHEAEKQKALAQYQKLRETKANQEMIAPRDVTKQELDPGSER